MHLKRPRNRGKEEQEEQEEEQEEEKNSLIIARTTDRGTRIPCRVRRLR